MNESQSMKELRARWDSYRNNTPYEPDGNEIRPESEPWWPDLDDAKSDVETLLREIEKRDSAESTASASVTLHTAYSRLALIGRGEEGWPTDEADRDAVSQSIRTILHRLNRMERFAHVNEAMDAHMPKVRGGITSLRAALAQVAESVGTIDDVWVKASQR